MLSYLSAETSFLRAFGNRSLLLIVLCCLTRTGETAGKASVPGLSLDINASVVVVFGPVLALLLLISLKAEADTLLIAREAVLDEASELSRRKMSLWVYLLFALPTLSAAFMTLQYIIKLVPAGLCDSWNWIDQVTDFRFWRGTPSEYCIGKAANAPWVYPPLQAYFYLGCVAECGYLTYRLARDWQKARGGTSRSSGSSSRGS